MNKKEVINYLIQQRNLDWQYFDNTQRLNKERFETEVNNLKYELCMCRFFNGRCSTVPPYSYSLCII